MNYIRTILIITFLYAPHIYNEDTAQVLSIEEFSTQSTKQEEPKIEEKTDLQRWNDHLELLKANDDYWDTTTNNPKPKWEEDAFTLAKKVLAQDKSMAETLKTSFVDALDAKTTKVKDVLGLIKRFEKLIDDEISTVEAPQETKGVAQPEPIVPEVTTPASEPVNELEPVAAQPETTALQAEITTAPTTEQSPKALQDQWNDVLETIKTEEDIRSALDQAAEIARARLLTGYPMEMLEQDMAKALGNRKLNKNILQSEMNAFRTKAIQGEQSYYPTYYEMPMQQSMPRTLSQQDLAMKAELEKQKKLYEEKDAQLKEELLQKEKLNNIRLAAAQKAQEEGKATQAQVHKLAQIIEEQKKTTKQKEAELQQQIQEARQSLAKYTEQIAAAQKAEAEKGILSTLSDWWYGTSAQKQPEISSDKQEAMLNLLVKDLPSNLQQAAKTRFTDFQNTLFNFSNVSFWDIHRERPNAEWITLMNKLIKDIVITYKIMPKEEVSTIIQNVFDASHQITPTKAQETLAKILSKTNAIIAAEAQQKTADREKVQRQKEKNEELVRTQQKIKDEQMRIEAEKSRKAQAAITYNNEKKEWYALLDKVAQSKQATAQDNHAHMQQALSKSQSLLHLAGDIPDKNKTAIAQKLKQKFSVALLEQQKNDNKNGEHLVNIHHHMDMFNNEINRMID